MRVDVSFSSFLCAKEKDRLGFKGGIPLIKQGLESHSTHSEYTSAKRFSLSFPQD